MTKKIALIMPGVYGIYEGFIKNLEAHGFELALVFLSDEKYKFQKIGQRLKYLYRRILFNDKTYLEKLIIQSRNKNFTDKLVNYDGVIDYALVIKPDYLSQDCIQMLKEKCSKVIAYFWDGLNRYPKAKEYINLFERSFVFDPGDFYTFSKHSDNLRFTTNFYFDWISSKKISNKNEVFFRGGYMEDRLQNIVHIADALKKHGLEINIRLFRHRIFPRNVKLDSRPAYLLNSEVKIVKQVSSYLQMIEDAEACSVMLDVPTTAHNGLSFRFFEALHFQKKIITTNTDVKRYDFYHPNNIFVWYSGCEKELKKFLELPVISIQGSLLLKYSFTNWINYVLDIKPYFSINAPSET